MANTINAIPEFTSDLPVEESGKEEVAESATEAIPEEGVEKEKETPIEPPAIEKPTTEVKLSGVDTGNLEKQIQNLQGERVKLIKEIQDLRGQKREIKSEEILKIEQKIDELKDVHPEDVSFIERILKSKGYVTEAQAHKMFYESVKNQELNKFLDKFPEYKPENDPNDLNWNALQKELRYYRMPDDPHQVREILERAHRGIISPKVSNDQSITTKKRQIEVAGVGVGGTQRSSSQRSLDSRRKEELLRGGWSEEDIKEIEKNLE